MKTPVPQTVAVGAEQSGPDPTVEAAVAAPARLAPWTIRLPRVGRAPEVLAVSSFGVLLVAVAYHLGRTGGRGAELAYWLGQVVVFAPVVARMLARQLAGMTEAFVLVIGLAVNQYLQKWLYSPDQFRFPDELQHWTGTTALLDSGLLLQRNPSLPVAVHFPGLEEMGAALAALTGLPVTAAGLLISGVAHLTFVGAIFLMVRGASGSAVLAGVSCLIYSTVGHYLFFDSMYLYQTAALPFLLLAVWASIHRRWGQRGGAAWAAVGVISIATVTVSHHITAMVLVLTLTLIGTCQLVLGRPRWRWSALLPAGVALVLVTAWFTLVATEVYTYFSYPVGDVADAIGRLFRGAESGGGTVPGNPTWELAIQVVALLVLFALLLRAGWTTRRSGPVSAWRAAVLIGAVLFFATTALRFLGAQGPELAGRAATFSYLPVSIVAAAALVEWRGRLRAPRWPVRLDRLAATNPVVASPVIVGTVLVTVLMLSARAGGWPAYWGRLPGPHLVSAFERSVDAPSVAAAQWTRSWLRPGNRFGADSMGYSLVSTYGFQNPVGGTGPLYYATSWTADSQLAAEQMGLDYLWVDLRLSEQIPRSGSYFPQDPLADRHTGPLPLIGLAKFDGVAGISRVYDNGAIRIYDVRRT